MAQTAVYNIKINCSLGAIPPEWRDFKTSLLIEASLLREGELIGNLKGFSKPWPSPATTQIVKDRSAVIPGSEGSTSMNASSNTKSFLFNIPKIDYDSFLMQKFTTLFVWAKPDGSAALSVKGKTAKYGLLKVYSKDKKSIKKFNFGAIRIETIEIDVEVHKSIISMTIDQIEKYNHNNNSAIEEIKKDRLSTADQSSNLLHYSLITGYPKVSENADARFGAMSVPRDSGVFTREAIDTMFNGQIKDISDKFWKDNKGALDLKPDLKDYGFFTTIGNTGEIYQADIFSNISWGYTGDYVGYGADQMNDWARLDPSPMTPQDDLSTIYGTKVNQDIKNPALANKNYRNEMFEYIVNILRTDERMTALWIKELEDKHINGVQRTRVGGFFPETGDHAAISLKEFNAGEKY